MKEGPSESKENKENREKKGEREASKGRAAANRKGKGANRSRQGIQILSHEFISCSESPVSSLASQYHVSLHHSVTNVVSK